MQPLGVSDATAAVVKNAEVAIPHRPGSGAVAAFDCTVQLASNEFSVINQCSCDICVLESAENGLQALTDS